MTTDSKETLAVPAGWKLVPEDPTVDMIWAGVQAALAGEDREPQKADLWRAMKAYRAMLSEVPEPEESEIRSAIVASAPVSPDADADEPIGWLFFNPDAGEEFSENHPIESGEVPDAQNVRAATDENLLSEMKDAWELQEQMRRQIRETAPDVDLLERMAGAIQAMLIHSGVSDVSDRDKFPEDVAAEREARAVLAAFKARGAHG